MKKEHLHQFIITVVVGISLMSFVYINFIASNNAAGLARAEMIKAAEHQSQTEQQDLDGEKRTPNIAIMVRLFEFAQKIVPSGR